ncbi:trypsin-like peptidase domain-containing protein [Streptomyces sp. CRN 30]|uniref:VMAP-C domain-containing protein n=1 Tax=Streptomyces sp. CRN 30 TaxID=3075613 RepID=UPI002A801A4F|nr:trypsin-like peptidase domain-containing protein [Streptomyces sp. CRN 30]
MSALEEMVRPSLARIVAPGDGYGRDRDQYWGSAFFVAPGWLLTCAHVVGKGGDAVWRSGNAVGVTWQGGTTTGEVVLAKPRPEAPDTGGSRWQFPDIALVRVRDADDARCVWLSDRAPAIPARVGLHGWSRETGDLGMRHGLGEAEALDGKALLLSGSLPVEGVSGGPVIDLRYGAVIGLNKGRGRNEGAAVPITALRELFDVRGGDVLHSVVRAHDLHHLARFTDASSDADWTRAQTALRGPGAAGLAPALRVHLYGHFAHLPPPGGPGEVMHLVHEVQSRVMHEEYRSPIPHDPRTWREGAGLLHGLRDRGEEGRGPGPDVNAVLLYAAKVARHTVTERRDEVEYERLRAFTAWVREQATLHAHGAIREEIGTLFDRLPDGPPGTAVPPAPRPEASGGAPADVLVTVGEPVYGERYPLSVRLLYDGRDVTPVYTDDTGVRRHELHQRLREPLAEALRLGDRGEHLAAVEFFLPRRLFDLPLDDWRLVPGEDGDDGDDFFDEQSMPLGLRRTVVIRDLRRSTRPPSPEWRRRWKGTEHSPLSLVPLRGEATADDHPEGGRREGRVAAYGRLSAMDDGCVPVFCGPVGSGDGFEAMAAALAAGHPLVLWRRDGHDHADCRGFHRQSARLVGSAGRAQRLHGPVRELRIRVSDPDTARAEELTGKIAVLFDPPGRPPHRTETMAPPPVAAPDL